MKQIPASLLTLTAGILVTLISLWVGQNHGLLPEQASSDAPLVDGLFDLMVTIGTALFIVVQGAIIIFLVMFRRREGDTSDGEPIEGNLPLEAFWTAIPAVIVIGLGIYSVNVFQEMGGLSPGSHPMMGHQHATAVVAHNMDHSTPVAGDTLPLMAQVPAGSEYDPAYGFGASPESNGMTADVVVNVTGMQFAWIFTYPDTGIVSGELHIPKDKTVQLNLTAQDVIHSFWVPQFRLKQDALPGVESGLRFVATKVGQYPVVCTELCGSYHGGMRTQLTVHTPEEYESWVATNRPATAAAVQPPVGVNTASLSDTDYLSPYAAEMGVTSQALAQLQNSHS
jgi:cytochrome c oxidase subunit II